jgi:hypothetical protein
VQTSVGRYQLPVLDAVQVFVQIPSFPTPTPLLSSSVSLSADRSSLFPMPVFLLLGDGGTGAMQEVKKHPRSVFK